MQPPSPDRTFRTKDCVLLLFYRGERRSFTGRWKIAQRHHARSPMYSIALPVPIGMWNNEKTYKTCVNVELTKRKCQRTSSVTRILLPCHVSMGTTGTTGVSDGHASDTEFCYHTQDFFFLYSCKVSSNKTKPLMYCSRAPCQTTESRPCVCASLKHACEANWVCEQLNSVNSCLSLSFNVALPWTGELVWGCTPAFALWQPGQSRANPLRSSALEETSIENRWMHNFG